MQEHIDFSRQKTSWTKYDIVQVLDTVNSVEVLEKFMMGELTIDNAILQSFLGITDLKGPIPEHWIEIQKYPQEKKIFSMLALIFTHGGVVKEFAEEYSKSNMKGVFKIKPNSKQSTNIRSALVVSEAAESHYRNQKEVPYDFSIVLRSPDVGKLFKKVLIERLSRLSKSPLSDERFYEECFYNNFHKALGLNKDTFQSWLEGRPLTFFHYIDKISIENFYSVKEISLEFQDSKEVYFLGENGDGKTLLLMAIYLAFNGNYILTKTDQEETGKIADILRDASERQSGELRLKGYAKDGSEYNPQKGNHIKNMYAYGTHRGRYSSDTPEMYGFMSLFDFDKTLIDPVEWLKDQKLLELENADKTKNNSSTLNLAVSELQNIFYELLERNVKIEIEGTDVYFIEKGYKLRFDELSEGYRSVILFVCDILYRLTSDINAKKKQDIRSSKGIVLVDEIDLHLHPKWQRVIIKKLRDLFPNIQFFFTTHSPTIIQGASEDAVIYRVYKDNGETKVSAPYLRKDLSHLMMNTLLTSSLFGMEDSRLDSDNNNARTEDSYPLYRINRIVEKRLKDQKESGKNFINEEEIDDIINNAINNLEK